MRVGIIGCGGIAKVHAQAYRAQEGVEVVAVMDVVPEAAERMAAELGAKPYTDWGRMLEEEALDAVSICTPSAHHAEPTAMALERGVAVLCEKPMAATLEQAQAMMAAHRRTGVPLLIAFCHRFHPPIEAAKARIEEGAIGQPLYFFGAFGGRADWRGNHRAVKALAGGGAMMDNGSHAVDLFRFLCGEVVRVSGRVATVAQPIETDDLGVAQLEALGPIFGHVALSVSSPRWRNAIEVYGTEGMVRVSYWEGVEDLHLWSAARGEWERQNFPPHPDRFQREIAHFLAVVRGEEAPRIGAENGLRVQAILEAIYRASERGTTEEVEEPS